MIWFWKNNGKYVAYHNHKTRMFKRLDSDELTLDFRILGIIESASAATGWSVPIVPKGLGEW